MHKPDPIEVILSRLMPRGLSDDGQREIEDMLDELAGPPVNGAAAKPAYSSWMRRMFAGGIAAAGVTAALVFPWAPAPSPVLASATVGSPARFVLVGESDRIESTTDEGWVEDSDGSAMQALRLSVVAENSIRDEETGIVMQVSEPREEYLLMPVSAF
jgi:hypothetical protein